MHTYGRFMLLYGKNHHNIVITLQLKNYLRNLYHYGNHPRHVGGLAIRQQVNFSS